MPGLMAALVASSMLASSCSGGPMDRTELVLGTVCSIRILDGGSTKALDAAFARLRDIESTMSANAAGHRGRGGQRRRRTRRRFPAPADVRYVTATALRYAAMSNGAFDPTIGPHRQAVEHRAGRGAGPVDLRRSQSALPLVDHGAVRVGRRARARSSCREAGMLLDLGRHRQGLRGRRGRPNPPRETGQGCGHRPGRQRQGGGPQARRREMARRHAESLRRQGSAHRGGDPRRRGHRRDERHLRALLHRRRRDARTTTSSTRRPATRSATASSR
ncbi:MAG: FAD:protein FMN transferase [Marinilabiliales bacterium]|nr:FAD:protein FMN transferase [Marinilabiliales bacterium]